jgi:hypothetical protein
MKAVQRKRILSCAKKVDKNGKNYFLIEEHVTGIKDMPNGLQIPISDVGVIFSSFEVPVGDLFCEVDFSTYKGELSHKIVRLMTEKEVKELLFPEELSTTPKKNG